MRNLEVPHSDITKQQLGTYPMPPTRSQYATRSLFSRSREGSTGQSKQRTREKGREDRERDVERSPRPLGSSRGAHNYPSPNAAAPPSPGEAAEEALAPTRSYKVLMRYSHQVHRLRPLQLPYALKTQPAAERVAAVCGGAIASGAAVCLACPAPTPGPSRGASPPALASTPPTPWSAGPGPLRPPKRWRGPRPP